MSAALLVPAVVAGIAGCSALGFGGCDAHVASDALPAGAVRAGRVVDSRDYCGDPGASTWRGWVIAPSGGSTAAQLQVRVVAALLDAGWRPIGDVPPVAPGFRSLCGSGLFATVFTADQAQKAEDAQQFVNEAPLSDGELQIVIGHSDACAS